MEQGIIRSHTYIFESDPVRLRPTTDDDFPILARWASDPEVLYFSEGDDVQSYTLEDIKDIYKTVKDAFCFIIEQAGIPIGECWLQKMNYQYLLDQYPGKDVRRIDISIGAKEYWGKGIETKVVKLMTKFGFEIQNADMIFCITGDYNTRSIKTAESAGYKLLSKTEEIDSPKAKFSLNYGMTKEEYASLNNLKK